MLKNSNKKKHEFSDCGITFNSIGSCFDNDYARNVTIFPVDKNSLSHVDNLTDNFLVLGEGTNFGINGSFSLPEKTFSIILLKQTQRFAWVYIIMMIIVIFLLMENEYLDLKPTIKMLTFQLNFVLEEYLMNLVLLSLEKYL